MKIYDVIPFFDEVPLLELRFELLNPYVDYFVVSESPWTFSGREKPLYFKQFRDRYKKFESKIFYHVFKDNDPNWNQWQRSFAHKGSVLEDIISSLLVPLLPRLAAEVVY